MRFGVLRSRKSGETWGTPLLFSGTSATHKVITKGGLRAGDRTRRDACEEHVSLSSYRYLLLRIASGTLRVSSLPLLLIKILLALPQSLWPMFRNLSHMH